MTIEERGSMAKRHTRGFVQNPLRARVYKLNSNIAKGAGCSLETVLHHLCISVPHSHPA